MKRQQFLSKTHHKIDGKFSRQRCLDPVFKNAWIRFVLIGWIRIILRGWIRIRIQSISDRICNPGHRELPLPIRSSNLIAIKHLMTERRNNVSLIASNLRYLAIHNQIYRSPSYPYNYICKIPSQTTDQRDGSFGCSL